MMFSSKLAKFGKGENLSAIMHSKDKISIYYFDKGIGKKTLNIIDGSYNLVRENLSLGYNEVIPISYNYLVSRIDKSIGIIFNE